MTTTKQEQVLSTKQAQVLRMERALKVAINQSNHRLVQTIKEMLITEKSRSVKTSSTTEALITSGRQVRAITNPKRMAIKLKSEKYDTRIELDSPEVIQEKRDAYVQKRKVFLRA